MIKLETLLAREVGTEVALSFFFDFPYLCHFCLPFRKRGGGEGGVWSCVSSAPSTAYFILSCQPNLSCAFGRTSCLFAVCCAYLVLGLAGFVTWMPPTSNYILLSLLL